MTTQAAVTTGTTEGKTAKAKRERKSFSVRLDGASGAQMRVTASKRRDGAQTQVVHTTVDGKKKASQRGATEDHPSIEAVRARADVLVAQAVKMGWKVREPHGGFAKKPDAFDAAHLPGPGTAASPKKK